MFPHVFKKIVTFLIIISLSIGSTFADDSPMMVAALTKQSPSQSALKDPSQPTQGSLWIRLRGKFTIRYSESGSRVQQHIHKFTRGNWLSNKLKTNAAPYLHLVLEEVEKKGMPTELALLPLVESEYEPKAVQPRTGAAGLWQIMAETGEWFGLKQEGGYDGRKDIHASTKAALSHLAYLHKTFKGDWLLALAAYNCGEGKVKRAIQKNKSAGQPTDYWSLSSLPQETKQYVPKLLALVSIVKQPSKYGFTLPPIADQPYLARVKVEPGLDLRLAAKMADMNLNDLIRHNAGLQKPIVPNKGPFYLLVPIAKASRFQQKLANSDEKKSQPFRYRVQRGDSLSNIASNYQTTIEEIQKANQLNSVVVHPGQSLVIPGRYQPTTEEKSESVIHIVQRGDSLWTISQLYQIPVSSIVKRNGLAASSILQPGQKIIIDES